MPNPTTTVWSRTFVLHFWILNAWRERSVSTSRVVPTRTMRKSTRSGVITRTFTSRADAVAGAMSP